MGSVWKGVKEAAQDFVSDPWSAVMFPVGVTKTAINAAKGDYTDGVNKHDQPAVPSQSPPQASGYGGSPYGGMPQIPNFWGGGQPDWRGSSSAVMGAPGGGFIQGMREPLGFDSSSVRVRQLTPQAPAAQNGGWAYQPGKGPVWTPGNRI